MLGDGAARGATPAIPPRDALAKSTDRLPARPFPQQQPLCANTRALVHPSSREIIRRFTPLRSLLPSFVRNDAAVTSLLFLVISLLTLLSLSCLSASSTPQTCHHVPSLSRLFIAFFISSRIARVRHGSLTTSSLRLSSFIQRTLTRWNQSAIIFHVRHECWIRAETRREISAMSGECIEYVEGSI